MAEMTPKPGTETSRWLLFILNVVPKVQEGWAKVQSLKKKNFPHDIPAPS